MQATTQFTHPIQPQRNLQLHVSLPRTTSPPATHDESPDAFRISATTSLHNKPETEPHRRLSPGIPRENCCNGEAVPWETLTLSPCQAAATAQAGMVGDVFACDARAMDGTQASGISRLSWCNGVCRCRAICARLVNIPKFEGGLLDCFFARRRC